MTRDHPRELAWIAGRQWGTNRLGSHDLATAPDEKRAVPGPHDDAYPNEYTYGNEQVIDQIVQIIGALLVLAGFLAAQADLVDQRAYKYLVPNAVGSSAMAATAVLSQDWGFVFLEGTWALVSYWGMGDRLFGRDPEPGGKAEP